MSPLAEKCLRVHRVTRQVQRVAHKFDGGAYRHEWQRLRQKSIGLAQIRFFACGRAYDDRDFAPDRRVRIGLFQFRQGSAADVLMKLRHFARDGCLASTQHATQVVQRVREPLRRLENDDRGFDRFELVESGPSRVPRSRQESDEQEAVCRQSRSDKRRKDCRSAGHDVNLCAGRNRVANELVARVRHEGRTGIADKRQALAPSETQKRLRPGAGRIVIVIGKQRPGNAVNGQKLCRDARVFGQDRVAARENIECAQAYVLRVPYGSRCYIKALFQGLLRFRASWPRVSHSFGCANGGGAMMHRFGGSASEILHDFRRGVTILLGLMVLGGCMMAAPPAPKPVASVARAIPPGTPATHPLGADQSNFVRLGNIPSGQTPVRIGILLPFSNGSATTRALADSLLKSAELAMFESHNRNLMLLPADEGSGGSDAVAGARALLAEGAEVIVGPLFSHSVTAIAPMTRDHAVPVISFSTDRGVAGDGVYLLSFQPENEVTRIVRYAAGQGHAAFAALVPITAYGAHVAHAFESTVKAAGARVVVEERFDPAGEAVSAPVMKVAQSRPDAVLIAQGGPMLRDIASSLAANGAGSKQVQYLGTGLWDESATIREPALVGGWFAAPDPDLARGFEAKFRDTFGSNPPALASLAYDAVSLIAALAPGPAYHRFTREALSDPNGFSGVDGVFRFDVDGSCEMGLAVLRINPEGNTVVISPAPRTFMPAG